MITNEEYKLFTSKHDSLETCFKVFSTTGVETIESRGPIKGEGKSKCYTDRELISITSKHKNGLIMIMLN